MITYVDYTLNEAIAQFKTLVFDYPIIYYILGAIVVLGIIILINLNTKTSFTITLSVIVISLIAIFYYRGLDLIEHIDTIFNSHFYQNIFFYYWNTIFGLLVMHIVLNNKKDKTTKYIIMIPYILTITNLLYSFYISNVVYNNYTLVVGNIAPIIILGNILLLLTYLYLIIFKIVTACKNKE